MLGITAVIANSGKPLGLELDEPHKQQRPRQGESEALIADISFLLIPEV